MVLHGASSPSQDLPLYEHLKQILPPLGVAVFVYDRRSGEGQYDFQVLAEDGLAARNTLTGNPHVDGARIGFGASARKDGSRWRRLQSTPRQRLPFPCLHP